MRKPNKAADFLQNMTQDLAVQGQPLTNGTADENRESRPIPTRTGLKHIGGYLDTETVERVAILRARLRLDNSGLIKLAIDELHRKQMAKRAFGDG